MRKSIATLLSLALLFTALFTGAASAGAQSAYNITEDEAITAKIKAYTDIKQQLSEGKPLADVKAAYVANFQTDVKRIDVAIKADDPKIDTNISFVLDGAIAGTYEYKQAKEAVEKGLLWYFYFWMRDAFSNTIRPAVTNKDAAAAKAGFDKVVQLFENTLQASMANRDKQFSTTMVEAMKAAINLMQADIAANDLNEFNVHRQIFDKTIIKFFSLATYNYAMKIPTVPVADRAYEITEGYFLFLPVYTYLRGGSPADGNYVLNAFASGDVNKIKPDEMKAALHRAMIGKVSEYVNNAIVNLTAKDLQKARGYAMEGAMFVSTQEAFLSKDAYSSIAAIVESFRNAVDNNNLAKTQLYGLQIAQKLAVIDGTTLKVGSGAYTVDGKSFKLEVSPFVNKTTYRTLVPTQLIVDALHAKVSYDAITKTVSIVKDGVTTKLVVGSDVVVENDKTLEAKLDQPVVLQNSRTFIPLRWVAEHFGNGVFYSGGDIAILR